MADAAENEPSMEEILSSIRRIINEDEEEAPAAEAEAAPAEEESNSQDDIDSMFDEAPAAEEPAADADSDDVLELTDMVAEPDAGTDPMDDDLMIVDRDEEEPEGVAEPEPVVDFDAVEGEVADGIMSDGAAAAAMGSFHTLADSIRISDEEGRTLEGVVRALLRPMLKEWLDANLPSIVDEKVQAEIDRVARRR